MQGRSRYLVTAFLALATLAFGLRFGRGLCLYLFDRPRYWLDELRQEPGTLSVAEQQDAVQALVRIGPAAVPPLIQSLNSTSYAAREPVWEALRQIAPNAVPKLVELLQHSDGFVRVTAVRLLGEVGPEAASAVPGIRQAQKDSSPTVREQALEAVQKITRDEKIIVAAIDDAARDQDSGVRIRARLSAIEWRDPGSRIWTADAYHALRDPDLQNRNAALRRLRNEELNAEEMIPLLVEAIRVEGANYYPAPSVELIGMIGAPAVPAICALLQDPDDRVRRLAADSLMQMGAQAAEAVPVLIHALKDDDKHVRMVAAMVLGQIGADAEPAVPALIDMLDDSDPSIRLHAAVGLNGIGRAAKPAIPRLIALVREDTFMANQAAYALAAMGPEAQEAVPAILELLQAEPIHFRCAAAWALGEIGVESRVVIRALLEHLDDSEQYVRTATVMSLGRIGIGSEEVVAAIKGVLNDTSPYVRTAAAVALARFGEKAKSAVPELLNALQDGRNLTRNDKSKPDGWRFTYINSMDELTVRDTVVEALRTIDPIAAAEAGVE